MTRGRPPGDIERDKSSVRVHDVVFVVLYLG